MQCGMFALFYKKCFGGTMVMSKYHSLPYFDSVFIFKFGSDILQVCDTSNGISMQGPTKPW